MEARWAVGIKFAKPIFLTVAKVTAKAAGSTVSIRVTAPPLADAYAAVRFIAAAPFIAVAVVAITEV